jgi:hypothetical protein
MDTDVMPISSCDGPSLERPASTKLRVPDLSAWLQARAEQLDLDRDLAPDILPQLGRAGLFRVGVPTGRSMEISPWLPTFVRRAL